MCFIYIFGFNDNTIRNQKIFGPISGNTQKMVLVKFSDDAIFLAERDIKRVLNLAGVFFVGKQHVDISNKIAFNQDLE